MTIFVLIIIAVIFFSTGFILGNSNLNFVFPFKKKMNFKDREIERIKQEYRNFLSYDGSEQ